MKPKGCNVATMQRVMANTFQTEGTGNIKPETGKCLESETKWR